MTKNTNLVFMKTIDKILYKISSIFTRNELIKLVDILNLSPLFSLGL